MGNSDSKASQSKRESTPSSRAVNAGRKDQQFSNVEAELFKDVFNFHNPALAELALNTHVKQIEAIGKKNSVKITIPQTSGASSGDQIPLEGKEEDVKKCLADIKVFTSELKICHGKIVVKGLDQTAISEQTNDITAAAKQCNCICSLGEPLAMLERASQSSVPPTKKKAFDRAGRRAAERANGFWRWQHEKDWKLYTHDQCLGIAEAARKRETFTFKVGKASYTVDPVALTQVNDDTGYERDVQVSPCRSVGLHQRWEWLGDNDWKAYCPADCKAIDSAWNTGNICEVKTAKARYRVDPLALTQTNVRTGYKRAVRPSPDCLVGWDSWQWRNDTEWTSYSKKTSAGITNARKNGVLYKFTIRQASYTINPASAVQTNDSTGKQREIRCFSYQNGNSWQRLDDAGWTSYGPRMCTDLDESKKNDVSFEFEIGSSKFTIDPRALIETNISTMATTRVRFSSAIPSEEVQWKYLDKHGQFVDYQPHHSKVLEAAHQSGKETAIISIGGNSYTVWVTELTQVNDKTRKPRDIRRVTAGTWSEPRMLSPLSSGVLQSEMVLNVRALSQDNINLFEEKLLKILSDSMDKMEITVPMDLEGKDMLNLHNVSISHLVEIKVTCNDGIADTLRQPNTVFITGSKTRVNTAKSAIHEASVLSMSVGPRRKRLSRIETEPIYPDFWHLPCGDLELIKVKEDSTEFQDMKRRFVATLTKGRILNLERIQSKHLWRYFDMKKRGIAEHVGGQKVDPKLLFHGTRKTNPREVYQSTAGFDIRYANAGFWGRANYFAVDANYSDAYAHSLGDGRMQMLVAQVAIGDSFDYGEQQDKKLIMPPVKKVDASSPRVLAQLIPPGHSRVFYPTPDQGALQERAVSKGGL